MQNTREKRPFTIKLRSFTKHRNQALGNSIENITVAELNYEILAIDRLIKAIISPILLHSLYTTSTIMDRNSFTQDLYSINISKSLRVGSAIFQINATRYDPFVNGRRIYSLRNYSEYFLIEPQTEIIRLKQSLPAMLNNITLMIEVVESEVD